MLLQAALSDVKLDFIDGVLGKDVVDKAIPVTAPDQKRLSDAVVGSWRAHMNAIHEIVRLNISSALIMEDDVAWDIRLKDQLRNLALSSQALTQPLRGSSSSSAPSYADITYPKPGPNSPDVVPEISLDRLPATVAPKVSPYGDDFGLLWLGHCGMHFPTPDRKQIPKGRVIQLGDETAPQRRYLWSLNQPFTLKEKYPEHTRAVHHVQEGVCSLAYAVTQKAARQLLHEIALKGVTDAFDILLRFYCEGAKGRAYHRCLTVQPSLVNHWKGIGPNSALSDIGNHKGFTDRASADMTRWAVRQNVDALFEGRTDYFDEYPDKEGE
ncbi:hypothetical protein B0T17DRAFT_566896 [Bombardia bombarda]|uniref:Glycosyltransferase family 25 protein n=1 Tax=Bombardia bombarda TaxID=252184 RepID=A0AA39XIQ0_9PEZI|nr:hypothetical protein B0T17DRAFT_566896 [Bombardia bombarda]